MLGTKGFIGCQVRHDSGHRFTEHLRHNRIQSHIADGKSILKTVFLAALHRSELVTIAGEFTQDAGIFVRDKAALYQPDPEQVADPFWNPSYRPCFPLQLLPTWDLRSRRGFLSPQGY